MFENIENLELINILSVESGLNRIYIDRFSHAFVFKVNGSTKYNFNGKTFSLNKGELAFIPKGSTYEASELIHGTSIVINFNATLDINTPKTFYMDGFPYKSVVSNDLINLWLFGGPSEHYKCFSVFYNILSFITTIENTQYSYKRKLSLIKKAVDYLHNHIFDSDLKINELHQLCDLSDTYFRKIFKANFGVTPQEYITNKRISQARALICNGDYNSISEVALSVGYTDSLYFSRVFSRKYGMCPSQYVVQN